MKVIGDAWSVVVVGAWNIAILMRPDWLAKHVFEDSEIKLQLGTQGLLRVVGGGVRLVTAQDRVIFSPVEPTSEGLAKVESRAALLLSKLSHTPVSGLGINFGFREEDPSRELAARFPDSDSARFADRGLVTTAFSVVRHAQSADGPLLNLTIRRELNALNFDFNFHRDAGNAEEAAGHLGGKVVACRDAALGILQDIYGLAIEGG